jgi:lysozyme
MKVSQNCINLIRDFEGLRLKPYLCVAGIPTIGIGCTRYDNGKPVTMADPAITAPKAIELLRNRLTYCENVINKLVTVPLNQNEFDALVSFVFNVGEGNLANSTLLRMLNAGEDKDEVSAQLLRWNKVGGNPVDGLTRRRQAERSLFLK